MDINNTIYATLYIINWFNIDLVFSSNNSNKISFRHSLRGTLCKNPSSAGKCIIYVENKPLKRPTFFNHD